VKGRYSVRKLIEKYGRKANMMNGGISLTATAPDAMHTALRLDMSSSGGGVTPASA
jgi:hypothetical protein